MTACLPPLPLLGEGGWGGEGQVCCATCSVWPYFCIFSVCLWLFVLFIHKIMTGKSQ